jgi:carbon monoxide dehydrogenase subunit G
MEFSDTFTAQASAEVVFEFLRDVRNVTACIPGARIVETVDNGRYQGAVRTKLGAAQMTFRGELEFVSDSATRTISVSGRGLDARGGSGATGQVTAEVRDGPDGSAAVHLVSHLQVSGQLARFGKHVILDIASRLTREFAANLDSRVHGDRATSQAEVLDIGRMATDAMKSRASRFVRGMGRKAP